MGQIRAHAIKQSGLGDVVAVYDKANGGQIKYNMYPTEDSIIEDPDIDAVFISTPNHLIVPFCKQALSAGKHVFAEKPPAFNASELKNVQDIERKSKKKLMYGFNHRHHDSIKKMKEVVDNGKLGKILWMRGRYGKEVDQDFFKGWRADLRLSGGGIMIDQGIHMLDLMLHLGGDFDEVQAMVSNLFWKQKGIEDNVFVNLRNRSTGICASIHSTMTQWRYLFSLEVFLEGGSLILNGLKTSSGVYGDEKLSIKRNQTHLANHEDMSEKHIVFHADNSWISEIQHFFSCIEENERISVGSSEDALKVMKIIDKIYQDKSDYE